MAYDQQWALARFREDGSRNDPKFGEVQIRHGLEFIWLDVDGNVGWYHANIHDGEIVDFRGEAFPQPHPEESFDDKKALNYAMKLLSPKRKKKIIDAVMEFRRVKT